MADPSEQLRDGLSSFTLADPLARIRPGYSPVDITEYFTEACQDLETGQLIKDENFSLWDSVQALEIMDPKMDSGVVEDGEDPADRLDVATNLLPSEIIWIMDEIICRELAWIRGFALFQTVFTSVHIHHLLTRYNRTKSLPTFTPKVTNNRSGPDPRYTHTCLHAFCMSTIIQCDMNADLVTTQQYYEEEDLNTQTYGLNLCNQIGDDQCLELLDAAMDWLSGHEELTTSPEEDEAIYRRLLFRRSFMSLFIFGASEQDIQAYPEQLQGLLSTHALGQQIDNAFDPKAYRRLAIGGPTRTPATLPYSEAITDLRKLCTDFYEGSQLSRFGSNPTPEALRLFLWHFAYRSTHPNTVARAKLQVQLFSQGGLFDPSNYARMKTELRDLKVADAAILNIADIEQHHPSSATFQKLHTIHEFMQHSFGIVIDSYRALCQNPCRLRRCLVNSLEHFDRLRQVVSDEQDEDVSEQARIAIIDGFLTQRIGWQSIWVILLGYEHGLYEEYELGMLYWIVHDTARHMAKYYTSAPETECSEWQRQLRTAQLTQLDAIAHLALGFSQVYAVLARLGVVAEPNLSPNTSLQNQWSMRVSPLIQGLPQHNSPTLNYTWVKHEYLHTAADLHAQLTTADKVSLESARKALQTMTDDDGIAAALFELPPAHFAVKRWRAELTRRKRAIVQMRLEIFKLRQALADGSGRDALKEGWRFEMRIPTTEERLQRDRNGNAGGHEWWVVPGVEAKGPSDHADTGGVR